MALSDKTEQDALKILASWDGVLTKESIAATIFERFYVVLAKNIIQDEIGEDLYTDLLKERRLINNLTEYIRITKDYTWCDDVNTSEKEDFTAIIQKSFTETINALKSEVGHNPDKWIWGNIHTLTLSHPMGKVKIIDLVFGLNKGPFGVGGSNHTVSPYSYSFSNLYHSTAGASHRHIYTPGNWDNSLSIIPTGTSGIPASDHYCDQTEMYLNNTYHSDYVTLDKVKQSAKYVAKFVP